MHGRRTPTLLARTVRAGVMLGAIVGATSASAEPRTAAVFDFQYARGSPSEPGDAERARLTRISAQFRDLLAKTGRYRIVSTDPVAEDVAKSADLRTCGGCADDFARKLGAQTVITGEVQKVSNLILNINVYVRDLASGAAETAYSVDLRGNTDVSFDRGIRYLVDNRLPPPAP